MKLWLFTALGIGLVMLGGCGSETSTGGNTAAPPKEVKSLNEPPKDPAPGEAYRITPADPTKKEFQQDPRLAGGK